MTVSISETTICSGAVVALEVSGAQDYQWIPNTGLDCATCPNVNANPEETTVYTVFGYNENGCETTSTIVVNVLDEFLMGDEIQYLCPGDTIMLDDGTLITQATIISDTIQLVNSCDSIHIIEIVEAQFPVFSFPVDITIEAGVDDTLVLDPNYSYTFDPSGLIPDCPIGCSEIIYSLEETQEFTVTITNEEGCSITETIRPLVFPGMF